MSVGAGGTVCDAAAANLGMRSATVGNSYAHPTRVKNKLQRIQQVALTHLVLADDNDIARERHIEKGEVSNVFDTDPG